MDVDKSDIIKETVLKINDSLAGSVLSPIFSCSGIEEIKTDQKLIGRLKEALEFWKTVTSDIEILKIVESGLYFQPSNASQLLNNYSKNFKMKKEEEIFMGEEIQRLLKIGSISYIGSDSHGYHCSPIFAVSKSGKTKYRMVIDLRKLNRNLTTTKFKMETLETSLSLMEHGGYFYLADIHSAYHSISIHEKSRKFLAFQFDGKFYVMNVLPFGLNLSPFIFTKVLQSLLRYIRTFGVSITGYIDDCCLCSKSEEDLKHQIHTIFLPIIKKAGFILDPKKGTAGPVQEAKFLGLIVDLKNGIIKIPIEKLVKIKMMIREVLGKSCSITDGKEFGEFSIPQTSNIVTNSFSAKKIAGIAGSIISILRACPYVKFHVRELYYLLKKVNYSPEEWNTKISLTLQAKKDLLWILTNIDALNGSPIWRPIASTRIITDASKEGWSGLFLDHLGQTKEIITKGNFNLKEVELPIHILEGKALLYSITEFSDLLKNRWLHCISDNQALVKSFERGSKDKEFHSLIRQIYQICAQKNIRISEISWIPSKENPADFFSRNLDHFDFQIKEEYFQEIVEEFGVLEIDRMATFENRKVEEYDSWFFEKGAKNTNTFTSDWTKTRNYVFPPFPLIQRILLLILEQKTSAVIVVPNWKSYWYPLLLKMKEKELIFHQKMEEILIKGKLGAIPKNKNWKLTAVKVSYNQYLINTKNFSIQRK